jgi:hypothetical protein
LTIRHSVSKAPQKNKTEQKFLKTATSKQILLLIARTSANQPPPTAYATSTSSPLRRQSINGGMTLRRNSNIVGNSSQPHRAYLRTQPTIQPVQLNWASGIITQLEPESTSPIKHFWLAPALFKALLL